MTLIEHIEAFRAKQIAQVMEALSISSKEELDVVSQKFAKHKEILERNHHYDMVSYLVKLYNGELSETLLYRFINEYNLYVIHLSRYDGLVPTELLDYIEDNNIDGRDVRCITYGDLLVGFIHKDTQNERFSIILEVRELPKYVTSNSIWSKIRRNIDAILNS